MPDKKISNAKCHICGQKIPFTYGNPKELIQHMLGCHDQETSQKFNPSCCPNSKPCVKIIDCPKKLAKCTNCGGRRQTAGKSATLCDVPEDAPAKCTICVAPPKEDSCKPDCPFKKTPNRRSSAKGDDVAICQKNSSTRINLGEFTAPVKLRIQCRSSKSGDHKTTKSQDKSKSCPVHSKNEAYKNKSEVKPKCGDAGKNRRSSVLSKDKSKESLNKTCKSSNSIEKNRRTSNFSSSAKKKCCNEKCKSSSLIEIDKKLSPSCKKWDDDMADKPRRSSQIEKIGKTSSCSLNSADQNKGKCGMNSPPEKNRRSSNTSPVPADKSTVCNKTVCFANNASGEPEGGKNSLSQYKPCNLIKRKGTKEMYKTTLETWSAGCGSMNCPRCHRKVVPLIRKKKNKIAFSSAGASLLLTCWPFCFLIPMLHNSSVDLYCPCCKYKLGVYNSSTGKTTSSVCRNTPNT